MPDFSFYDILIFFIVFFLIFRKLFTMSGPNSNDQKQNPVRQAQDLRESVIDKILEQAASSNVNVSQPEEPDDPGGSDELDEPVYKEKLDIPAPFWKDPETAFEEGKPEFHNIAAPPVPESDNKDFQFHQAMLFDQDVFNAPSEAPKGSPLGKDWMTPGNIKKAFILKEILDPPVSKRTHRF